jgi:hypothetical protein
MENPTHPSNNAKKKGRNRNNNNPGQGENQPQQNQPTGGNQNQGNQNPQGGNNNRHQWRNRNTIKTSFPCALCSEFGHYTHHFPQIADFKWLKDSGSLPHPPAPPTPQQAPQQYMQQPTPAILQNPTPHQGVINTQQDTQPTPPQLGQYLNPNNPTDHTILLTSEEEILLQTRNRQHRTPVKSPPIPPEPTPTPTGPASVIPRPTVETPLHIPRIPLRRNVHNPQARASHNYSLVDDLAQSSAAMSVLEVLQTCPIQWKSLLSALGSVDPVDTQLITFDLDSEEPRLPTLIVFQIPVKIRNITVHQCIIDEGASTCIMFKYVWQKLGSPELIPSFITLRAYDRRPSSLEGLFQNVPVELGGKTMLIDIEVINTPLDYNIMFGHSYMYAMKAVASSVFRTMMFPHNRKIITIDQVSYYEPNPSANIDKILPLIHMSHDAYPLIEMGPRIFKDPSLLGTYHGAPLLLHPSNQVCIISSNGTDIKNTLPPREASIIYDIPLVVELPPHKPPTNSSTSPVHDFTSPQGHVPVWETVPQAITQIPFFYPPPGVQAFQLAATLTLPNMVLAILVWYLHPPKIVPQPSLPPPMEGIPMTILILTPTIPSTPSLTTLPAIAGGSRKKKEPTAPLPLHIQPPCALCEKDGHQTNNCPSLPKLRNVIPLSQTPSTLATVASIVAPASHSSSKGLRTKFACTICSKYGHYTHHFPALPRFQQTLATIRHSFQNEPNPATSSLPNITDIHYVTTSVNERMRCPCSLCESLDHFTYQCPMIIEYRQRQLTLIQTPTKSMVDLTSSLEILHSISPEPEALPTTPYFLDDLSKDSPPNPPNSPIHFPTEILHPTTTGTPQYFDIWFMSSEPSQFHYIIPPASSSPGGSHMAIIIDITPYDPLYSRQFHCDEDILEELNTPDYPWDVLHHRALFFP